MVGVIYGTTGELIKLAPVLVELQARGSTPLMWCTGQQAQQIPAFQSDLHLPAVAVWLRGGPGNGDLHKKRQIPGWALEVMWTVWRRRRELRTALTADGRKPFLLVHGDTMTTVLGALAARVLRVPVGHIEAGMRSGDWRNPFPEELNRRTAAKLVNVHYAPGAGAVANLQREHVGGDIVDTKQNTIRDALTLALDATAIGVELPDQPFGLVSIHRFELIEREQLLLPLLELLREHSRHQPLLFVDHSTTKSVLDASPALSGLFDERFRRIPRQPYLQFIALLRRADFLVSDSGGSQEESAMLGLPCLIHRAVSEHATGLGETVVLSGLDLDVVREFLAQPSKWRTGVQSVSLGPSKVIADDLAARGVL
jgi:UDP-N-acetylglucosamine 2-epimerase (non-hydrolysing)